MVTTNSEILSTKNFRIRPADANEFKKVAVLLSDEMYGPDPIPKGQKQELIRLEEQDLRSRYGKKKYTSMLLVAEDLTTGAFIGCVGVDNQSIDMAAKKLNSVDSFTNEEDIIAVLSNLVVSSSFRGQGIARQLARQCELQAETWGMDRICLTVESKNTPAKNLYKRLGTSCLPCPVFIFVSFLDLNFLD